MQHAAPEAVRRRRRLRHAHDEHCSAVSMLSRRRKGGTNAASHTASEPPISNDLALHIDGSSPSRAASMMRARRPDGRSHMHTNLAISRPGVPRASPLYGAGLKSIGRRPSRIPRRGRRQSSAPSQIDWVALLTTLDVGGVATVDRDTAPVQTPPWGMERPTAGGG